MNKRHPACGTAHLQECHHATNAETVSPSPCRAGDVTLHFEGRDGEFAGMSHDGAMLVLRNRGRETCTVPRRPVLIFRNGAGKVLAVKLAVPAGMHPGPVMLEPGEAAQGAMRWVSGEVYDRSVCVETVKASLALPGGVVSAPLEAHLCEPAGQLAAYEQQWLQRVKAKP